MNQTGLGSAGTGTRLHALINRQRASSCKLILLTRRDRGFQERTQSQPQPPRHGRSNGCQARPEAHPCVRRILLATRETRRSWLGSPDAPCHAGPQDAFAKDEIKPSCLFFALGKLKPRPGSRIFHFRGWKSKLHSHQEHHDCLG